MSGTEQQRQQQGEQADPDRQVLASHDRVEGGRKVVQGLDRRTGDRQPAGEPIGRGAGAGQDAEGSTPDVERRAEQVTWVAPELVADALGGKRRAVERHGVADGGDLVPADAVVVPEVLEADLRLRRQVDVRAQLALEPADGELDLAGPLRVPARDDLQGNPRPAYRQPDGTGHRGALRGGVVRALLRGQRPVAVAVNASLALVGRDLGDVLDRPVEDVVGGQDQPVVVVDGGVAQRMRLRNGGKDGNQ